MPDDNESRARPALSAPAHLPPVRALPLDESAEVRPTAGSLPTHAILRGAPVPSEPMAPLDLAPAPRSPVMPGHVWESTLAPELITFYDLDDETAPIVLQDELARRITEIEAFELEAAPPARLTRAIIDYLQDLLLLAKDINRRLGVPVDQYDWTLPPYEKFEQAFWIDRAREGVVAVPVSPGPGGPGAAPMGGGAVDLIKSIVMKILKALLGEDVTGDMYAFFQGRVQG